ncbi:MAG: HsdM family class I SAM-dependent methyltransferase [Promethearchaeota archaeon]
MGNIKNTGKQIFSLSEFESELNELEQIYNQKSLQDTTAYHSWKEEFIQIYGAKSINLRFYIILSLLFFTGRLMLLKKKANSQDLVIDNEIFQLDFEEKLNLPKNIRENSIIYCYSPLLERIEVNEINLYTQILSNIFFKLEDNDIPLSYQFDYLIQNLISSYIRHGSGEFYTPPFLVKKMVNETFKVGDFVLDPSCGAGNFLIEIINLILSSNITKEEKIQAIKKVHGYDINPMSIFLASINIACLVDFDYGIDEYHLKVVDSLFIEKALNNSKYDLVIGNPPWYTLRDIESVNYQEKIKQLSDTLGIKPKPKNVLNIEIASLFFYKANFSFMKKDSKIFYVIPKGVLTGSHASLFRSFKGFKKITTWMFENDILKIFNIDFICLYAEKSSKVDKKENYNIPVINFGTKDKIVNFNYFDLIDLQVKKKEELVPYSIETKGEKVLVSKFISKEEFGELLHGQTSHYKDLFHKGADLNPRNLIFVTEKNLDRNIVSLTPDERIFKRAKIPWNFLGFQDQKVNKKYIFNVIKSTELVSFNVFDQYKVFLPLEKSNLSFEYVSMDTHSKQFYDLINNLYLKNKKKTTNKASLLENLNHWAKLITPRQLSQIKVVYNNSGSTLNSAVIEGDFLVTGDLSFYDTTNIEEAYYLSSVLNSRFINKQIKIRKSSRHIFKKPFETPIPKFDINNDQHRKLADLGRESHKIAKLTLRDFDIINQSPSKFKIQEKLKRTLKSTLDQIDEILTIKFFQ